MRAACAAAPRRNLLVELFVEELPPKSLKALGAAFEEVLAASLVRQGVAEAGASHRGYASPRRLAVWVEDVATTAADRAVSTKLMPVAVALDPDGQPTPALLKKLAALGVDASAVPRLQRRADGKADALFLDDTAPGVTLASALQIALDETVARLPIAKLMRYQLADGWRNVQFVRPVHSLTALHGSEVVPVTAFGLEAGRQTHGHRFEAAHDPIVLRDADSYAAQLRDEGAVIASYAERRADVEAQLARAADVAGGTPVDDPALLDEVTALVERPHVLAGRFDAAFLDVPQECLILTMKANQKYFPLLDGEGRLTNRFLIVSNIRPADASAVVGGNERVVRPRLADAKFFYDQDRRTTLASRVEALSRVVYHGKLGSQGERTARVSSIAAAVAALWRPGDAAFASKVTQAAQLAKADLQTDMVGEFPELQGVMGGYYARHDGLDDEIAQAIEDHYKPRFAGDALPRTAVGRVVALADKLETLVGLFGIGQLPTGDRDPYALRRHALGVIRMLTEGAPPLSLDALLASALPPFGALIADPREPLREFIGDRLAGILREQGYSAHEVDAVLALRPDHLSDVGPRLAAVRAFAALPEATALAAANKRVGNILRKSTDGPPGAVDVALLREPAEAALWTALGRLQPPADAAFERGEHAQSLSGLAGLKEPVDAFFEQVMVNADDAALRANRLALLGRLHRTMNRVADLSRLAS